VDDSWSLNNLLEKAKTLVTRYGINGLVLDPWNEIEHTRTSAMSETEYISKALTQIRQFARLYNVHVWVVAHPTKLQKDNKTGDYPPPTPYDISGSSNWRNKSDNCVTVYRRTPTAGHDNFLVDIFIMKVRFKEVGKVGGVALRYDPDNSKYYETSAGDMQ
jgi:twinkle protein